jgi:hypothetical protein
VDPAEPGELADAPFVGCGTVVFDGCVSVVVVVSLFAPPHAASNNVPAVPASTTARQLERAPALGRGRRTIITCQLAGWPS